MKRWANDNQLRLLTQAPVCERDSSNLDLNSSDQMIGSRTSDNSVAFRPTENQKWPQSLEIISRWSKNRYYGTPTFLLARGKVEISPRASQGVRLMSKRYATSRACDVICFCGLRLAYKIPLR